MELERASTRMKENKDVETGHHKSKNTRRHEGVESHVINPLLTKLVSVKIARYWPRSLFAFLWTSTSSQSIKDTKREIGQYRAILTSRLVINLFTVLARKFPLT